MVYQWACRHGLLEEEQRSLQAERFIIIVMVTYSCYKVLFGAVDPAFVERQGRARAGLLKNLSRAVKEVLVYFIFQIAFLQCLFLLLCDMLVPVVPAAVHSLRARCYQ